MQHTDNVDVCGSHRVLESSTSRYEGATAVALSLACTLASKDLSHATRVRHEALMRLIEYPMRPKILTGIRHILCILCQGLGGILMHA